MADMPTALRGTANVEELAPRGLRTRSPGPDDSEGDGVTVRRKGRRGMPPTDQMDDVTASHYGRGIVKDSSAKTVPADLVQLSRYAFRYRKLLWIAGVPTVIVSLFLFDTRPAPDPRFPTTAPTPLWIGVLWLVVGLAICVVAASRRAPSRDLGVRLMLDRPHVVDRILVYDTTGSGTLAGGLFSAGGITQIVFFGGGKALSFVEIEDPRNVAAALETISAHLPGVPFDYEIADDDHWVDKSFLTTLLRRF